MRYIFTVHGHPVPAARMTQKSKWSARARRSLEYQQKIARAAKAAKIPLLEGDVILTCRFFLKTRGLVDLSNLVKNVEDSLQYGGILKNDRQVITYGEGTGIKVGATFESVEIEIEEI